MKLVDFLEKRGVHFERHEHARAMTAQSLAQIEGVPGREVAKPVVVCSDHSYAMCVVPAGSRVDLRRAAAVLGVSELRMATENELAALFPDCELGAEPPLGMLFGLKTIMDSQLRDDEHLVMQSGTHTQSVRVRRADWERICRPLVAPITQN